MTITQSELNLGRELARLYSQIAGIDYTPEQALRKAFQ